MRHLKQKWKSEKIFSMGLPFVWGARYFLSSKLVCHFLSFECASPNVLAERKNRAEAVLSLPPLKPMNDFKTWWYFSQKYHYTMVCDTPCVHLQWINNFNFPAEKVRNWLKFTIIFPPISLLHPISIPESFVRQLCWGIPNEWRRLSELESYCCTSPFPPAADRLYLRPCVM